MANNWWESWWFLPGGGTRETVDPGYTGGREPAAFDWMRQNIARPDYAWGPSWQDEWETFRATQHPWVFNVEPVKELFRSAYASWEQWNQANPPTSTIPTTGGGKYGGGSGIYGGGSSRNPPPNIWGNTPQQWEEEGFTSYEDWLRDKYQKYINKMNALYAEGNLPQMGNLGYDELERLMGLMEDPGQFGAGAEENEARSMGFFDAAGNPDVTALRAWKGTRDFSNRQGLSAEQETAARKAYGLTEQKSREQARLMAETAFGNSGGMLAKMNQAYDEANRDIADSSARFEVDLMNQDFAAKLQEQEVYDRQFQTGQIAYQDYLDAKQAGVAQAVQAWSMRADTLLAQYNTEWGGILNQAQLIQGAAALEMGVDQHTMDMMEQAFALSMSAQTAQYTFQQLRLMIDQLELEIDSGNMETLIALLGTITDLLGTLGELFPREETE